MKQRFNFFVCHGEEKRIQPKEPALPINTASSKDFRINFIMQTNHLVTAARRSLLFLMVALLLGGGLSSAPANTADQVASSAKEAKPIEVGTAAPDAGLRGLDGNDVTLHAIVAGKPTVLIFYRGSWCPYCNLHLSDLVTVEEELRSLGYQIVAISPDRPEELNKMTAADHLNYRLFSDPQAEAMKKFGVAYQVDNTTLTNYKQKFNVDLESSSGQTHHILPVPAVFILDRGGKIVFVHADPDYKVRMKGAEVLAAAKAAATTSDALQK
jgi:peroxiredoxin